MYGQAGWLDPAGIMVTVAASFATILFATVLMRARKVAKVKRSCFERIENVGFKSDGVLRALDKSIALSVPPVAGSNGSPKKPFENGIVFIGGFGDMPHIWEDLTERASRAGWYSLAPRTPGWGRTDFGEADKVSWTDWVLACRDAVAVTRGLCDEVTVVAHSTGAPIAAMVAERYDIDRLICTGPNFISQAGDRWAKKLLLKPVIGMTVTRYLDAVAKKRRGGRPIDSLNEAAFPTAYYLTCFPVRTLRQMWILQDQLRHPWRVSSEILLLMGESDGSVAPLAEQVEKIQPFLPEGVPFKACYIPNAAHGLPTETKPVVDTVASAIFGDVAVLDTLVASDNLSDNIDRDMSLAPGPEGATDDVASGGMVGGPIGGDGILGITGD